MKALALLVCIGTTFVLTGHGASAESTRITLMLSGTGCESSRHDIETTIRRFTGVQTVDGQSIPGHLLIDVDKGRLTGEELAHKVTELGTEQRPCRSTVMESCITASFLPVNAH